jgi:hypothetical protein
VNTSGYHPKAMWSQCATASARLARSPFQRMHLESTSNAT